MGLRAVGKGTEGENLFLDGQADAALRIFYPIQQGCDLRLADVGHQQDIIEALQHFQALGNLPGIAGGGLQVSVQPPVFVDADNEGVAFSEA